MALQDQTLSVSFSKGINTKIDPKQILPGELLYLKNGVFSSPREITEDNGTVALPTLIYNSGGQSITLGNSLSQFNGQLVETDNEDVYSFSQTEQAWVKAYAYLPTSQTKIPSSITSSPIGTGAPINASVGVARDPNGIECYAWCVTSAGGAETFTTLIDSNRNTILFNGAISFSGVVPMVSTVLVSPVTPSRFIVFVEPVPSGATRTLSIIQGLISTAPLNTLIATPFLTLAANSGPASIVQSGNRFYVFYSDGSTGLITLKIYNLSTLANAGTLPIVAGTAQALSISVDSFNNVLDLLWFDGTSTKFVQAALGGGIIGTVATLALGISPTVLTGITRSATVFDIFAQHAVTGGNTVSHFQVAIPAGTVTPTANHLFNTQIATVAYLLNGFPYLDISFIETVTIGGIRLEDQAVYVSIQFTNAGSITPLVIGYNQVNKYSEGTAGIPAKPSQVLVLNSSNVIIPYLSEVTSTVIAGSVNNYYNVFRLSVKIGTHTQGVSLGDNLNLTGGMLHFYDGLGVAENGFTVFPSGVTTLGSTPTGGFVVPGTYSYLCTYEWTDNYGNLHRSAPSIPTTTVVAGTSTNTISIVVNGTSLSEAYKIFDIQVVLWRTQNGGTIYYRTALVPNASAQLTIVDVNADTTIINSTQLYTTGGEVENIAPPGSSILIPYKNRLIAVEADQPFAWWYSKQVVTNFPVEFSDLFVQNIDEVGGPISAGSVLDDKLIFFKNSNIFYVIGDGPSPAGTNNDFSYPQLITGDVGCMNQHSIVTVPIGLMFQSTDKGIYLLDRALILNYIGAAVEEFNNQLVTSAALIPGTTQVRFSLATGPILIYDYLVNQWSTHVGITLADSAIYEQSYVGSQANGQCLQTTPGLYSDNGVAISLSLTTGWFSFAHLQGYQRIRQFLLLLTSVNATSLQVTTAYNFDPTIVQTDIIPILASSIPQQYRIFTQIQKCNSMQITITEIPTGAQGGGLTLSGVDFYFAFKKGLNKLPATVTYG
jgi:hypothetical protein